MFRVMLGFAALVLVSGCATDPDYAVKCMFELNPQGSYDYPAGQSVPTVTPGAGGTQAGANAMNACIRAKAAAAGTVATTRPQSAIPQTLEVQRSGTVVSSTYTYGTPPGAPVQSNRPSTWSNRANATTRYDGGICRGGLEMRGGTGYFCRSNDIYISE